MTATSSAESLPAGWSSAPEPTYQPISAYGVIGDMRTAALVSLNGSIDWCCLPEFGSSSTFAAILDAARGGTFQIAPAGPHTSEQRYLPATNVLVTAFHDRSGTLELCDFMPVGPEGRRPGYAEMHRRLTCTRGQMDVSVRFSPRFDYGVHPAHLIPRQNGLLATDDDNEAAALSAPPDLWWQIGDDGDCAQLRLLAGESAWFVLRYDDDEVLPIAAYQSDERLKQTIAFWDGWVATIKYEGAHRAVVERSALTLKLLCYQPPGAIIAAPTTSLPEEIGGERNWDYRFVWLRDASFTLDALQGLGQYEEASAFISFLRRIMRKATDSHLQIMYGVDGSRELPERTLPHLSGYRDSAPVRVGNAAAEQLQLDVYGEILAMAYRWSRSTPVGEGTWWSLSRLVDWISVHWVDPDSGIWEVRATAEHYVMSKVMCWVALDRGVKMAREFGLPANIGRWESARDAVWSEVMDKGWSEKRQSFVQFFGTEALDAANLVIPMVGFLPPDHERVKGTIAATLRDLSSEDRELIYRYRNDDGLPGEEGVFAICTFWMAQALILSGDAEQGERIFCRMLKHANHLGLYSEELDPETGAFAGNFPQGLTHIALINCALALAEVGRG